MRTSENLTKIAPALVAALSKIEGAAKKKTNPGFKSKYADLESVIDASRDILTENGLTIIQLPGALVGNVLTLETILLHESGEYIAGDFGIALGKTDPQGVGSALTYARRYAQMAALNMPAVDDDGEAAMGRNHEPQPQARTRQPLAVTAAQTAITSCENRADLTAWKKANETMLGQLSPDEHDAIVRSFKVRWEALAPAKAVA